MFLSRNGSLAVLAWAAVLAMLAVLAGSTSSRGEAPARELPAARSEVKNLVVVTLDTVRADRLGCYGYFRDTTPNLDALAKESVLFRNCRTPVAQTTPSHTSLFTGVTPQEHGVLSNHKKRAARDGDEDSLRMLAERLRERGFRTGGFVGATPCKRQTGLAAGFEAWTEPSGPRRSGAEVVADALRFLEQGGDEPAFAWLHLFDAHEPLEPPHVPDAYCRRWSADEALAEWLAARGFPKKTDMARRELEVAELNARYDGALRFLDDQLGVLLERLRQGELAATTALVVVADHGTSNGQHDHMGHGLCWDEQLRVPLFVKAPGLAPREVDVPMSMLDIWPTVFALLPSLADARFLEQCIGRDVLAADFEPRPHFAASARTPLVESVTFGRWKLLRAETSASEPRRQKGRRADRGGEGESKEPAAAAGKSEPRLSLYDLEVDPNERNDVAAAHPDVVAKLVAFLDAEVARQRKAQRKAGGEVDPATAQDLDALGYADDSDEDDRDRDE